MVRHRCSGGGIQTSKSLISSWSFPRSRTRFLLRARRSRVFLFHFSDRQVLVREVKKVRQNHNSTPDNANEATSWNLCRYTYNASFERVLVKLPNGAVQYWYVEVVDPREVQKRIF